MLAMSRRAIAIGLLTVFLAACKVVPETRPGPAPVPTPQGPSADVLPTDTSRHRVALLVPLSGENAAVGRSIANATTMALLDTNAETLRITTYDTATDAGSAAARAIADGNKLILGPLVRRLGAVPLHRHRALREGRDDVEVLRGVDLELGVGVVDARGAVEHAAPCRRVGVDEIFGDVCREYGFGEGGLRTAL